MSDATASNQDDPQYKYLDSLEEGESRPPLSKAQVTYVLDGMIKATYYIPPFGTCIMPDPLLEHIKAGTSMTEDEIKDLITERVDKIEEEQAQAQEDDSNGRIITDA